MGEKTNSKKFALFVLLASLSIALDLTVTIPFAPLAGFGFGLGEIPMIVGFLLLGLKIGTGIAALDCLAWFMTYPNPYYPLGGLIALTSMMLGIYLIIRPIRGKLPEHVDKAKAWRVGCVVGLATFFRVVMVMPYTYYSALAQIVSDPIVFSYVFPWLAVYNILQSLITLPASFAIARTVRRNLKSTLA